jgi:hypothetical protein
MADSSRDSKLLFCCLSMSIIISRTKSKLSQLTGCALKVSTASCICQQNSKKCMLIQSLTEENGNNNSFRI